MFLRLDDSNDVNEALLPQPITSQVFRLPCDKWATVGEGDSRLCGMILLGHEQETKRRRQTAREVRGKTRK